MTAHFLRYSAIANNLTPKFIESDIMAIISNHYPAHVKRTMLSEGLREIRDVLILINKPESLEADGGRKLNSRSSAQNGINSSDSKTEPS